MRSYGLLMRWLCAAVIGFVYTVSAADKGVQVYHKGHAVDPGRILAKYKNPRGQLQAAKAAVLQSVNLTESTHIPLVPGLVILEEVRPNVALQGGKPARKHPKEQQAELTTRLRALQESGLFEYAEPDYLVNAHAAPSDEAFTDGRLWGLRNLGQSGGTSGTDVGATTAWDITTGNAEVIVAVIDTGIRYTHRDLSANMWRNPGEIPNNGVDDDQDGYVDNVYGINAINGSGDPMDDQGHGTHVAGTIGAAANDGNPHVGVAWRVKLIGCKFLPAQGGGKTSDAIKCIDFAVSKGARILNNSWGGGPFNQATFDAIARARDRGVLFVAAAGNDANNNDSSPSYPSGYDLDNIISVAAIDRHNQLADFSNYGASTVDIAAPGVEIYSTWKDSDTDYKTIQGTSMATPHVSGVAALVLSHFPGISAGDLKRAILNSAVAVSGLQTKVATGGRVNAFNAVSSVADGNLEISVYPPTETTLLGGTIMPLRISVSDFGVVNGASITANIVGSTNLSFVNDGQAPDEVAGDDNYTALLWVPPFQETVTLNVSISAPGKTTANFTLTYPVVLPPANNDFEKRTPLTGVEFTISSSSLHASKQPAEPFHADVQGGKSVWYTWTAPASGQVFLVARSAVFDTLLAVYGGNSLGSLTHIVSNDDTFTPLVPNARALSFVTFPVTAGQICQFAVDGFGGDGGAFELELKLETSLTPPPNDNFSNRVSLPSLNGSSWGFPAVLSTFSATREGTEPLHAGNSGGKSVWFYWQAPDNGIVNLSTHGSSYDTLLAVYTGTSLNALTPVAANDDGENNDGSSTTGFSVTAGTTYSIAVDGYNGAGGILQLTLTFSAGATGPANDSGSNAIQITGASASVTGSNIGATKTGMEPDHADNAGGKSVWWYWTAPANGVVTINTTGSSFDTLLAIYTASTQLDLVTANDDGPSGTTSQVVFYAVSGTTYYIAVDGYQSFFGTTASGSITLNLTLDTGVKPVNDNYANKILLSGNVVKTTGSNVAGTKEVNEPNHAGNSGGRSVWWTWMAPVTGLVEVSTKGSNFDTLLAVYGGSTLNNLTIASNDQSSEGGNTSKLSFFASAGMYYTIAVDGKNGASGEIKLAIEQLVQATLVYGTSFETGEGYSTGSSLAGQNGWLKSGTGGNGIINEAFIGRGQQAYVGFSAPNPGNSTLWLYRPINLLPEAGQLVAFGTQMQIVDSTNGRWDTFRWGVYNGFAEQLFRVVFDNNSLEIFYVLDDGVSRATGYSFSNDLVYDLRLYMDFANNTWTATLNGFLLISNQPITTKGADLSLGDIDAGWNLRTAGSPGNNYMVFDDYAVALLEQLYVPTINTEPQSQTLTAGQSAILSVAASGTGPLMYQWYKEGELLPGKTTATLNLGSAQASHAGRYWVVVSNSVGTATSVEAVLLVNPVTPVPANDLFANRITISGSSNVVAGVSVGATKEANEPVHAGNAGGKSVWWSWTAPGSGTYLITTAGSDFDTLLNVYTGSAVNGLVSAGGNDDPQSQTRHATVRLNAIAGTTYQIAVDGYNGDAGQVRLTVKPAPNLAFNEVTKTVGGNFSTGFAAEPGIKYVIQVSSDLVNWVDVQTVTGQDGVIQYVDTEAGANSRRFYRAIQAP